MDNINEIEKIDFITYAINFMKTVKRFWKVFVIGTLILGGIYFAYTRITYTPIYESQITFTVNTDQVTADFGTAGPSEQIRESMPYILNSSYMKNMVMDDLGLSSFPAEIQFVSKEFVEFYEVHVQANDPEMAYNILNSVVENCPKASVYVLGQISLNVLDETGMPVAAANYQSMRESLMTGFCFGVVIMVALAFLYTLTNRTVGNEEELKKYLNVACLANLPNVSFKKRRKEIDKHIHIHNDKVGQTYLENIRILRARVERNMQQIGAKTVLVTSSIPKEGKSTVATNLALSLAEKRLKVALVDLDLRNPSVYEVLGKDQGKKSGIAEFLSDKKKLEVNIEKKWNLSVFCAGERQSNPVELLKKNILGKMIQMLRAKYDYVIIDTPPAAMLSDAAVIAKHTDAVIYVVKQDYARVERIIEGMEALGLSQTPILGVVLNGVETVIGGYGSYRYGNYGVYEDFSNEDSEETDEAPPEYVKMNNPWEVEDIKKTVE